MQINPVSVIRNGLSSFLGLPETAEVSLFSAPSHPLFATERANLILQRTEILALIFAVLVPLWILIDARIFPGDTVNRLAIARSIVAFAFALLLLFTMAARNRRASIWTARIALLFLLIIPALFEIYVQTLFSSLNHTVQIASLQQAAISLYRQLPIVYVIGIALFPLSLIESVPLVIIMIALSTVADMGGTTLAPFQAANWSDIWMVAVVGIVSSLAALLQLNLLWNDYYLRYFDVETGLLKRESGMNLLHLLWGRAETRRGNIGVAMLSIPPAPMQGGNKRITAASRWADRFRQLQRKKLFSLYGVRWERDICGFITYNYTHESTINIMMKLEPETSSSANIEGNSAAASRVEDHCDNPVELVLYTESRLKQPR